MERKIVYLGMTGNSNLFLRSRQGLQGLGYPTCKCLSRLRMAVFHGLGGEAYCYL